MFRIAVGLLTLGWFIALGPDLFAFFSRAGILPTDPRGPYSYGVLRIWPTNSVVVVLYVVSLVAALCLTLGYRTRVAAVVVWVATLSFQHRNPFILNSGDGLVRDLAFFLMLAPSGVSLSFDRWRRHRDRFWEFPARAPWALRLVQVQLSILYLTTVWDKVRGTTWNQGTAVSYALRIADISRFHLPSAVSGSLLVSNLLTYGTLAIELALGLLVWNRRARPWVLAAGVAIHLFIELTILVGFFSLAIFAAYFAWVPPDAMTRAVLGLRDRCRAYFAGTGGDEPGGVSEASGAMSSSVAAVD